MQIENINVSVIPNKWNIVCSRCGKHLEVRLSNDNTIAVETCHECYGDEGYDGSYPVSIYAETPYEPEQFLAGSAYAGCPFGDDSYSDYNVILCKYKDNKIKTIKLLRDYDKKLSLKETCDIINSLPRTIAECICKSDAEELKKKFEALGCVVKLKAY
jgi:ribosomal protein L7/L12